VKDPRLKIDLHVHTCYSEDASTTLKEVIDYAEKKGLNGVAITDHNTLDGARKLVKESGLIVIPGLEVETRQGHVLALNITTSMPSKLNLVETVQRIHENGGTAIIAHPYAAFKGRIKHEAALNSKLDAIEVVNAAAFPFFSATRLGKRLAEQLNLPQTGGSDAHHRYEIGRAYTLVEADPNVDDVIEAIRKGAAVPCGRPISWSERMKRLAFSLTRLKRKL